MNTQIIKGWTVTTLVKHANPAPHFNTAKKAVYDLLVSVSLNEKEEQLILPAHALESAKKVCTFSFDEKALSESVQEFALSKSIQLEQQVNTLLKEVNTYRAEVNTLEQSKKSLEHSLNTCKEKVNSSEQFKSNSEHSLNSLAQKVNTLEHSLTQSEHSKKIAEQSLQESEHSLQETEHSLNTYKEQVNTLLQKVNTLEQSNKETEQLKSELEQLKKDKKTTDNQLVESNKNLSYWKERAGEIEDGQYPKWAFDVINVLLGLFMAISCVLIFTAKGADAYSVGFGLTLALLFSFLGMGVHMVFKRGIAKQKKVAGWVLILMSVAETYIHFTSISHFMTDEMVGDKYMFAIFVAVIVAIINYTSYWFKKQ